MEADQPPPDEFPSRIAALSEETVNKIAAGEVVVRPANAVKELLENSLDAGATEIIVTAKKGGMELIQIQDNGKGIHVDDLPIVCARFTTSKLKSYDDLKGISTFGFRGEALASVSYVAKLTIKTKTNADKCANVAKYKDGAMIGDISRSAGLDGTIITVEELFQHNPARRRAMKSASDEMNRIGDVITQYAINYPKVTFAFRRCGSGVDFRTAGNGSQADVVSSLMGKKLGKDLIALAHDSFGLNFSLAGCMAKPSAQCTAYGLQDRQNRQKSFIIFINGRNVECAPLKQTMDTCFAGKQVSCPFLFLSLKIAPERVDVNVHPAKLSVFFLDQERIIDSIDRYIGSEIDKVFGDQGLATGSFLSTLTSSSQPQVVAEKSSTSKQMNLMVHRSASPNRSTDMFNDSADSTSSRVYAHHLVRTDAGERSLKEFQPSSADISRDLNVSDVSIGQISTGDEEDEPEAAQEMEIEATQSYRELNIDSVRQLRNEICESSSETLREMFKQMTIVGAVDSQFAMIQFSTAMYMLDIEVIGNEFFYQSVIFSLGNLGSFSLQNEDSEPLSIAQLMCLAPEDVRPGREEAEEGAKYLLAHGEMLWDYFSIQVKAEEDGTVVLAALPSVIDGFVPALEGLPVFLLNLLMKVDWNEEKSCLEGIARCIAELFTSTISISEKLAEDEDDAEEEEKGDPEEAGEDDEQLPESPWRRLICHYLLPACKAKLIPPEAFKDDEAGVITRVVDLHDLYKVFERC